MIRTVSDDEPRYPATGIRWHRRVGVRIGALVAVIVLLADVLSQPLWREYWEWLRSDLDPPSVLLEAATALPEDGILIWISPEDRFSMIGESLIFAAILALIAMFIVSRIATRRLARLAKEARAPIKDGQLPGPFHVAGQDEIESLARSMNDMRSRITELVRDIDRRDAERREWIAQISHDLRTPVAALSISLDRSSTLADRSSTELTQLLAAAKIDAKRVGDMTADLLDFARLDAGSLPNIEPVPAGEIVTQVRQALAPLASERNVRLDCDLIRGLPTFSADGRLLLRALENLVMNSIQHARSRVMLRARANDDELLLTVEDDGPGFGGNGAVSLNELSTRRSRSDSTGIGLKVASRVVELHGGSITARDRDEGGACIEIRLPITDGDERGPEQTSQASHPIRSV